MNSNALMDVLKVLIGAGAASLIQLFANKRRSKAETDSLAQATMEKVLLTVNKQLDEINKRYNETQTELDAEKVKGNNYRMTVHAMDVELNLLKHVIRTQSMVVQKLKVFVLDDYSLLLNIFKQQFKKLSVIDLQTFETVEDFLIALPQKPEIIVVDYLLDKGYNAGDILDVIQETTEYEPKVIVMSGQPVTETTQKLEGRPVWKIYQKSGAYVFEITTQIMEYVKANMI